MIDILRKDIFTLDNLLHGILGAVVMLAAWFYLPLAASMALYLREQGQSSPNSKDWTLGWSLHKHAEWFVPSAVLAAVYPFVS